MQRHRLRLGPDSNRPAPHDIDSDVHFVPPYADVPSLTPQPRAHLQPFIAAGDVALLANPQVLAHRAAAQQRAELGI